MEIQRIINDAMRDSGIATRIMAEAIAALGADLNTTPGVQIWTVFLREFAVTEKELRAFTTPTVGSGGGNTPGIPTKGFLLAYSAKSTVACTMTTTTTTASIACNEVVI